MKNHDKIDIEVVVMYGGWIGKLYSLAEGIMKLAYVNLLWILFTLCGVIVLGVFPSTVGMFAVIRKWIMGNGDVPVFKTFWGTYRKEFLKANLLGYFFILIGVVLYVDLRFFHHQEGVVYLFLSYISMILFLAYLLTFMYFFPVFVHYDLKKLQYLKQSFMIMILRPINTILMVVGGLVVYYLMIYVPGLIPFFGVSTFALIEMWLAYKGFTTLERKLEDS